ncbi:MAG TPA: RsmE family RNA methyltransferase [Rectinemataceae bacterium]|nr:RsmE family RNA methyltransferase [Rectinemataceae bacterium]
MNILYLDESEIGAPLPRGDRRREHVARILKKKQGEVLAAGCSDGTLGQARIEVISEDSLVLSYSAQSQAPSLRPVRLLMGFPRPIQAGRILKDLTSLGVAEIWFTLSDLGDKSYAESTFFKKGEYGTHLIEGAEQAGNPRLPAIGSFWSIDRACAALELADGEGGASSLRLIFHPDPSLPRIATLPSLEAPVTIAIGSERGWTQRELELLGSHAFTACYLGDRILKTETAAVAAVSIILSSLGYM